MAIFVKQQGDKIIVEKKTGRETVAVELTREESLYLMKKIAEIHNYRVYVRKPRISFKLEPSCVKVVLKEGKLVKTYTVPHDLLVALIKAIVKNTSADTPRVLKKKVAEDAFTELREKFRELDKYFENNVFAWDKFFGSRTDYYTFFYVPLLLLEEIDLVKIRSRYIEATEKILNLDVDKRDLIKSVGK